MPFLMLSYEMSTRAATACTPELVESYQKNGAVCLRNLLNPTEIETLIKGIEKNLLSPSPRVKIASPTSDSGLFVEDFCNWQEIPDYRTFIFNSPISAVAGLLMGSQISRLYHDHLLIKEAGTRQPTPWHQDQPYYNIEGKQNCSLWIPVDSVSRSSTLEFISGSHLGPWFLPRTFKDNQAKWFPEGTLADLPDIDANRSRFQILGWELEPGDVVCFHMLTLHASGGVGPNQRRRAFSVRFLGDDVVHAPRPWVTSPDFSDLESQIPKGAAMDHPLFPILWHRESHELGERFLLTEGLTEGR